MEWTSGSRTVVGWVVVMVWVVVVGLTVEWRWKLGVSRIIKVRLPPLGTQFIILNTSSSFIVSRPRTSGWPFTSILALSASNLNMSSQHILFIVLEEIQYSYYHSGIYIR